MNRLCPHIELPQYRFVPGNNIHPLKPGGHMYETGEPETTPLTEENYQTHNEYLYAIDLINYEFYWEAHVYLEAIWNEAKRKGPIADLCKGLIKLAAFAIKRKQKEEKPAIAHLERAKELLQSVPANVVGIDVKRLIEEIKYEMKLEVIIDSLHTPYFTSFKEDISNLPIPKKFTYPFFYRPDPLSALAAKELQDFLKEQTDIWDHNFGLSKKKTGHIAGKMFGVLIVRDRNGELGYLKAYSGKIESSNEPAGFVPHIYDELKERERLEQSKREINLMTSKIQEIENDSHYIELIKQKFDLENERVNAIKGQKEYVKAAKLKRHTARESKNLNEEETKKLRQESILNKYVLKSFIEYWNEKLEKSTHEVTQLQSTLNKLKDQRKQNSISLQIELMDQYRFLNAKGDEAGLSEIFRHSKDNPPSGTGDCAAPKLLQFAYKNSMHPLAMAEFWWGDPHKSAIRTHGNFYPACKSKCLPLLDFMLEGIDVEPNPMLNQRPTDFKVEVIFEDDSFAIINKPPGLLSVPGKEIIDSIQTRMESLYPKAQGPLIVHRLDQCTSGIMIITKTAQANKEIQSQFINRTIQKSYVALLEGTVKADKGIIDLPLRVDLDNRPHQLVCHEYGKSAVTKFEVIQRSQNRTRIYFWPKTGRTHQLRVHSAHVSGLGCPILGDDLYGNKEGRLHLHAQRIEFNHPITKERVSFEVPEEF